MADMHKPIFDIDQPSMQAEIDSYEVGAGKVWPTFFPLRPTSKFDIKINYWFFGTTYFIKL